MERLAASPHCDRLERKKRSRDQQKGSAAARCSASQHGVHLRKNRGDAGAHPRKCRDRHSKDQPQKNGEFGQRRAGLVMNEITQEIFHWRFQSQTNAILRESANA